MDFCTKRRHKLKGHNREVVPFLFGSASGFGDSVRRGVLRLGALCGVERWGSDFAAQQAEQVVQGLLRARDHFAVDIVHLLAVFKFAHQQFPIVAQGQGSGVALEEQIPALGIGG